MSFAYPRTISVSRPNAAPNTEVGDIGYSADRGAVDETPVVSDLPASIQLDRQGQRNVVGLPSDARYQPIWRILIPKSKAALGSINSRDIVTDDLGNKYQVFADYWDSLGYRLGAILLEP